MTATYQPTNKLSADVKAFVAAKLDGVPEWALFLRWRNDGTMIYVQSSSGSNLALVDFAKGEVRYSDRIPAVAGRVDPLPASWRREFIGFDRDGNYADEATRRRMEARYAAEACQRDTRREGGWSIESYQVRPADAQGGPPGSLGLSWPNGFSGGGWLVRNAKGTIVFASAWRVECLAYVGEEV